MGTRGSALALAQARLISGALSALNTKIVVETIIIKTSGDLFGAPPPEIVKTLPQGAKGLWIKELEEALLDGRIDFAVHSAKDLPAFLAPGLSIAAYPEREDARDAFVARKGLSWASLGAGDRVATSSLRRRLMLVAAKPGVRVLDLRGNVDTRLRKLAGGEYDAMVIAVAGLKRLGLGDAPYEPIDARVMIPAPAQGSLALEVRSDCKDAAEFLGPLDHAATRTCVEFERAFLGNVGGGCGAPVGAYARLEPGGVSFEGFFAHEGAASGRRVTGLCADPARRDGFIAGLAAQAKAR